MARWLVGVMMGESLYIYFNIISFYCCICIAKVAVFLNKPQRSISRCDDGGGGAFLIVHTYCTVCCYAKASVAAALLIIYEFCGHWALCQASECWPGSVLSFTDA